MGAPEGVVAALQHASEVKSNFDAATEALRALRNLSACAAARPRLMACEAHTAVLAAVRKRLTSRGSTTISAVSALGCATLRNLAVSPEHRAALMAAGASDVALQILRSCSASSRPVTGMSISKEAVWSACSLLMGLSFEPANRPALLLANVAADAIRAMRRYRSDTRIAWAVAGLLLKLAEACAVRGAAAVKAVAAQLPLLEEGIGAALAMHGAEDARIARAAVAAVLPLITARAARGDSAAVPAALIDAVRLTMATHELKLGEGDADASASAGAGAGEGSPASSTGSGAGRGASRTVVSLCRIALAAYDAVSSR